jgi:hypothetical protein
MGLLAGLGLGVRRIAGAANGIGNMKRVSWTVMRTRIGVSLGWAVISGLAALAGGTNLPAAPGTSLVVPTNPPLTPVQIVTCRDDVNVDGMIQEMGVAPIQVYKGGINGFAGPMAPAVADQLKHDPRVLFVEADGPVALCDQTIPTGLVRMGMTNFPVAHIDGNPYGTNVGLNVDVAVLDSGIDATHPDLQVYQTYIRHISPTAAMVATR